MAHITYHYQRDKNLYEKTWDYSPRITWWISFITNWFWFTDITELTSNKRTCHKGINLYFVLYAMIYIACIAVSNVESLDSYNYLKWASWIPFIILPIMVISPCFKLMFKFIVSLAVILILLKVSLLAAPWQVYSGAIFVMFTYLGCLYNSKYLAKVKTYKGFELVKVEENKYSCYYLYNKLLKKDIKEIG